MSILDADSASKVNMAAMAQLEVGLIHAENHGSSAQGCVWSGQKFSDQTARTFAHTLTLAS